MRIVKRAAVLGGAALITTAIAAGTAPAAQALPEQCQITVSGHTAASRCAAGTGEHQVRVKFRFLDPTLGEMWFVGPWAAVGAASEVYIPLGGTVVQQVVGTR